MMATPPLCKDKQSLVRADGGCLECDADQGETCRKRPGPLGRLGAYHFLPLSKRKRKRKLRRVSA